MPPDDSAFSQSDELISAAHAAVSWVRARRATWASAPMPVVTAAPRPVVAAPPRPVVAAAPRPVVAVPPDLSDLVAPPESPTVTDAVHAPEPTASRTFGLGPPVWRWAARSAVAAAVLAAVGIGGRYLWTALPALPAFRSTPVDPKPSRAGAGKPTGSLHVTSTPAGAQVVVDGKPRGVTPLDVADVSAGRHEVTVQGGAGSVQRTVTVAANATVTIDEAIFSGFVTIYAPFDVTISEGGRVLSADDRHQVMLPPGAHELRVTNRTLGYEVVRRVTVKPGEATNVQLTPAPSALTVTSTEPAEVWVDGTRLGDTPLTAAPVALGVHDIVIRRAAGGERRFTLTIGTKPYTLAVDFQPR